MLLSIASRRDHRRHACTPTRARPPRHATREFRAAERSRLGPPFHSLADGGPGGWRILDSSRSCTSARRFWCRTWPDGAGSECRSYPDTAYFTLAPDWACEVLSASTRKLDLLEQAPDLRPRRHPPPVAGRSGGPDPRGIRVARRAVASDCERAGRRCGEHPAVRCNHVQSGGAMGLNTTGPHASGLLEHGSPDAGVAKGAHCGVRLQKRALVGCCAASDARSTLISE